MENNKHIDLLNYVDIHGNTLMHIAAKHNQIVVLEFLFEKTSSFECFDKQMRTPLHIACLNNNPIIVDYILKKEIS